MKRAWILWLFVGILLSGGCAAQRTGRVETTPLVVDTNSSGPTATVPPSIAAPMDAAAEADDADFEDLWDEDETLAVSDPLEPFNRVMFWFNDKLYFYLVKPVARVYRVVPEPARRSVGNFFTNLGTPVRFANSLLQLKITDASSELARFMINSTFGIAGLFDVVEDGGGPTYKEEDFGQTLGRYGAGQGFYLVLPVLGPSSFRDGIGTAVDWVLIDPLGFFIGFKERFGLAALDTVNDLSLDKDTYESLVRGQLDPYLFIRDGYLQRRASKVAQ